MVTFVTFVSPSSVGTVAAGLTVPKLGDGGVHPPHGLLDGEVHPADGLGGSGSHRSLELATLSQHDGVLLAPVFLELSQGQGPGVEERVREVVVAPPVGFGVIGCRELLKGQLVLHLSLLEAAPASAPEARLGRQAMQVFYPLR